MLFLYLFGSAFAQENSEKDTFVVARTVIIDGDTIPNVSIEEVVIFPRIVFKNKRHSLLSIY